MIGLGRFDGAVAVMALMDMADVSELPRALGLGGAFVFSILHPCFQPPGLREIHETEETGGSIGIRGQPVPHLVFHRPLAWYMNLFFDAGFVLDGFAEPHYERRSDSDSRFDWNELPPAVIFRFRKMQRESRGFPNRSVE